ncbi:MAG TPA: nitronate monooxygenase [Polyangiaceae bacterium]|nr:nitronate monooxygenase [Polyangiaceae bacterium]
MDSLKDWPQIIQGGMGIGVSDYRLARATSKLGCLGVVSGTGLDTVLLRRLQLGDPTGEMRRALAHFPWPDLVERVLARYFVPGGKPERQPFRLLPMPNANMSRERLELIVLANFAEVWLAKEDGGRIGINFLEKIQTPLLASVFGAVLAGVDAVLIGAGIPFGIPEILDHMCRWEASEMRLALEEAPSQGSYAMRFDPQELFGIPPLLIQRPKFFAIISSHVLAKVLHKKTHGGVDGFIVEDHRAGGHNAPPRKTPGRAPQSPPAFGPADLADLEELRAVGVPFWVAGCRATHASLQEALEAGARGVQLGTVFAFCDESAVAPELKRDVLSHVQEGRAHVVTDFDASPTGYPFKRIEREGSPNELEALRGRERVCDLGYLRRTFVDGKGHVAYRCPGEPVDTFVSKGGDPAETQNKLCLCNQLFATIGLGQPRETGDELPLLTSGEDLPNLRALLPPGKSTYTARDVVDYIMA